jgi:hypothetical protein
MPTATTTAAYMLALYSHLTTRDRALLGLLDEHRVLTTGQIRRLFYHSDRTCQIRLRHLHQMGILERFRFARLDGGSEPWHWTLGLHGARFRSGVTGRPSLTERTHRDRTIRVTARADLNHLLTANEFFVRLAHRARSDPGLALDRWWSEPTATSKFQKIRPDGHGVATIGGRTVGWFLECDMGTETLTRLVAKLDAYAQCTDLGGPRYPVLFWLKSPRREAHLHEALRGTGIGVPVATATHDKDPAGLVWRIAGTWERQSLAGLPCDHGPDAGVNPNWVDDMLDLSDQGVLDGIRPQ